MTNNPSFGGKWTEDKLLRLKKYLHAYRQIFDRNVKAAYFHTIYVDAFAGSGKRVEPQTLSSVPSTDIFDSAEASEAEQFQQGSVEVALSLESPFDSYLFIEQNEQYAQELNQFIEERFSALRSRVTIQVGDANTKVLHWCEQTDWKRHRAVVFLDPYGMQVEWKTLEAIAATQGIDMWLLFPLGQAVNRLLTKQAMPPDSWAERLTLLFGTDEWKSEFYKPSLQRDMFNMLDNEESVPLVKNTTFRDIQRFFVERLKTIFADVAEPRPMLNSRNVPLFLLCFAASNKKGAKPAMDIAHHILQAEY